MKDQKHVLNRKEFFKKSTAVAFGLTVCGSVIFKDGSYTGDCKTTSDVLGPFYRPGAPITNDLTLPGQKGELIFVKGTVFSHDCKTPLENALVEVWHADDTGEYVEKENNIVTSAMLPIGADGSYQFKTVLPGYYLGRPRHIHYRVTGPDHKELISQLYFEGDTQIEKSEPGLYRTAKKRILPLSERPDGSREVTFDIYMESS